MTDRPGGKRGPDCHPPLSWCRFNPIACDIYALGVTLYLLVNGWYPFEEQHGQGQDVVGTLRNIAAGRMKPPRGSLSPACRELIAGMLERDPAKRLSLKAIREHPWLSSRYPTTIPPPVPQHQAAHAVSLEAAQPAIGSAGQALGSSSTGFAFAAGAPTLTPTTPRLQALSVPPTAPPLNHVMKHVESPIAGASPPTMKLHANAGRGAVGNSGSEAALRVPARDCQGLSEAMHGATSLATFCKMWFRREDK